MKVSQEEIEAALSAFHKKQTDLDYSLRRAIKAALKVRRARKQTKRERQRKEKDKQVVESVKALEWDGKFGIGEWEMRDGQKQVIYEIDPNGGIYPLNAVNGLTYTKHGENFESEERQSDLIRPWPKGEQ